VTLDAPHAGFAVERCATPAALQQGVGRLGVSLFGAGGTGQRPGLTRSAGSIRRQGALRVVALVAGEAPPRARPAPIE